MLEDDLMSVARTDLKALLGVKLSPVSSSRSILVVRWLVQHPMRWFSIYLSIVSISSRCFGVTLWMLRCPKRQRFGT